MFLQFKKLNNESGVVLFIVLMTAIIIMIFSVGMLSQSMNEINYAQQQIDQITADQFSKGMFWNEYAPNSALSPGVPVSVVQPEGPTNYSSKMTITATNAGLTTYSMATTY